MTHYSLCSFASSMRSRVLSFFLLITLLHAGPSFSQSQTDIKSRKIKSITTLTTDTRKGDTTIRKNTSRYDARGNVIESIDYDAKGNVKDHEQFQFSRHDDEEHYIQFSPDGKLLKKTETHYNKWNNPVEKLSYDAGGNITEKTIYVYNTFNNIISEITSDAQGKEIRKILNDYDNHGMLVSRKIYNEKSELIYSRNYSIEY